MPVIKIFEVRTRKFKKEKWFQEAEIDENLFWKISTYIWSFGGAEDPVGSSKFKVVAPSMGAITRELERKYGIKFSEAKKEEEG